MLAASTTLLTALNDVSAGGSGLSAATCVTNLCQTDTVSAEINDKLAKQTQLREQQDNLALLRSWREEQGSLPESLSTIAEQINPLGRWEVKEIAWQDRQLVLELDAGDMDIAALVNDLESAPRISTIGIRPHGSSGAYLLEATFNE